jgi:glycosyltransferase involved in cell wall biosynthesis
VPPVLAVVIPTFNRASTLPRALESVLAQDADGLEIIVVDDGSTDDTLAYLDSVHDARLVVVTQENRGVCAARNAGVRATQAEFVTFLDSDDEALAGWAKQWLVFAARGIDFASCAIVRRRPDGQEVLDAPGRSGAAFGFLHLKMLAGAYCVRRQLLIDVGGFREGLRFSENTDLGLRLGGRMLENPFTNEATCTALVAIHESERSYDPQLRFDSAAALLEHDRTHLERSPRLLSTYAAVAGVAASRVGRRSDALGYLGTAIRYQPLAWRNYARFGRALLGRSTQSLETTMPGPSLA